MSDQSASQLHLLRTIASCADKEEAASLILKNPCLFSSRIQMELGKAVKLLPQEERVALAGILDRLQAIRIMLEKKDSPYPIGDGPLERIWNQLSDGIISQTYATQLARELGANDQLSLVYIRAMGSWLSSMVYTEQWRLALIRYSILMAAVESMPPDDEARIAYWRIGWYWILAITSALSHYGDYRIYRNAISVGEKIIEQAHALKDQQTEGEILHRLGVLCLDPYNAQRSVISYEQQIDAWRRTLLREAAEEVGFIPSEEWWMPEPIDALHTAEQYLRRAVEVRQGNDKGLSLKALVDTLNCRYHFVNDKSVDVQELCSLAEQALTALDQVRYLDYCVAVLAILMNFERSIEQIYLDRLEQWLSAQQLSDFATATNDIAAYNLLTQGIQILDRDRPRSALALLRNGRNIVDRLAPTKEEFLVRFLDAEIQLVIRAYIGDMGVPSLEGNIIEEAKEILRNSVESSEDPRITSVKLLYLAFISGSREQEDKGVVLLDWIEQLSPELVDEHRQSLTLLRFYLLYNRGAWAVNAGETALSALAYTRSLTPLLDLGLKTNLLECLTEIEDVASHHLDLSVALVLADEFQPIALDLEYALEQPATFILQRIYQAALPVLWTESGASVAHTLIQMAKGARFAAVNQGYNTPMVLDDELSRTLLTQIQETEKTLSEHDEAETEDGIDDLWNVLLLTAYDQEQELYPGSSLAQRLANLRRSYDTYLNQSLFSHISSKSPSLPDFSALQAMLDEHTVLVNCYIGQSAGIEIYTDPLGVVAKKVNYNIDQSTGGEVTSYLVACTREEVFAVVQPMGIKNKLMQLESKSRKLMMHPLSLIVSLLREDLNIPSPDGRPVAHKVAATLEEHLQALFGSFVDRLEDLKAAGKNHLCIIPHGPLHYYPFHLLGANGKTLADDWVVTYLPNINLLFSGKQRQTVERGNQQQVHVLTSVGLSFEHDNPFHLDVLPQSITEANSVAGIFKQTPIVEQEATKQRVIEALEHSRYVHLSTHGRHCIEAPAFQCVYLAADETSDGRLFAYELLSLNLHNLELLTLSACETALGRFDLGDNLRGIPASLLLRGVTTIVGTLWEISPEPAEHFFTLLYRELQSGKNRLDAFAAAQRGVRSTYPRYIDWGAFYFIGDWR